jgi:methyltransferase family protein
MPVLLKQYGERRTGTNYLRYLVQTNCDDAVVLMHVLGDKHSAPQPFDQIWRATRGCANPDLEFVSRTTFAVERFHDDLERERADVAQIAGRVAAAFACGTIGYLVSIKDPYAWVSSIARHSQWRPSGRVQDGQRVAAACRRFNQLYAAWLSWARERPSSVVRYEDLLREPERTVDQIAKQFQLTRKKDAFADTRIRMERQVWDGDPLSTMREPFDPDFYTARKYLQQLDDVARDTITRTIDWTLLAPYGYEPAASRRSSITRRTPEVLPTLHRYRNAHAGGTIVVCGCGTSLSTLDRPSRFVTIGVNDVGRLFQPDYLVVLNPRQQFRGDRFKYVAESKARALFTHLDLGIEHPNIVRFRLGRRAGTDVDDSITLPYTRNSPYVAMALAMYMGAKRIGVVGVDFTDDHFFGNTGRHPLARELPVIDQEYKRLYAACRARGIEVFNLSETSRLTAFPKLSLRDFTGEPQAAMKDKLKIVSYATTPVVGVPLILSRAIAAKTSHECRTIWFDRTYGNGVKFEGDVEYRHAPGVAGEILSAADVVIVHNGKVAPQHAEIIRDKPVVTLAHQGIWNVDCQFVERGDPGLVVAQYVATLPEFEGWTPVPNPMPLWEPAYELDGKPSPITICYTPSVKHESYPLSHRLYSHGKGYRATMRVLERIASEMPVRLEVIRERQVSHADALAMKRRSHIVIDECVTGGYHRNSLEGLALGAVVVNAVGMIPAVLDVIRGCTSVEAGIPFAFAPVDALDSVLRSLIAHGEESLCAQGRRNWTWLEQHWDFAAQWPRFWEPAIAKAMERHARGRWSATAPRLPAPPPEQLVHELSALPAAPPVDDVTVVVPFGGRSRLRNLRLCLEWLRSAGAASVIVVEMDSEPHARSLAAEMKARYMFVLQETAFHKARAMNAAIPMITTSRFLWLDADMLMTAEILRAALAELDRRGLDCLVPYASVRYLGEADTDAVAKRIRNPNDCTPVNVHFTRNGMRGTAFLMRTDFVKRYGGLLEEFQGWGAEDTAFYVKATVLGRAATSLERDLHLNHAFHPVSGGHAPQAAAASNPNFKRNMALLQQLRRIRTKDDFLRRFPPPSHFTAPWSGTKRIACTRQTQEIGRVLSEMYGPAVAIVTAAEPHHAAPGHDASRTAYESAMALAATLAIPAATAAASLPMTAAATLADGQPRVVVLDQTQSDLTAAWPWPDSSIDSMRIADVVAYLPDKVRTMNELWRVLRGGGTADLSLLTTDGPGAFADPTRVSFWNRASFEYYEDGHPVRERVAQRYGIAARFRILRERSEQTAEGPRLTLQLEAVK